MAISPRVRCLEHEAVKSPHSSAKITHASYTSIPQCALMTYCLIEHRDNFSFIFLHL
jgi:hypothetical protein